ncbi:MAG: hypothetical protein OXF02_00340 [Simkaniaceae bacterium]|nr:hypothetical protein [Simkaniaceae bacterium]
MATQLDTMITSGPAPKESDVDASRVASQEATEVARKADRAVQRGVVVTVAIFPC